MLYLSTENHIYKAVIYTTHTMNVAILLTTELQVWKESQDAASRGAG